jgi:hypothetical protein
MIAPVQIGTHQQFNVKLGIIHASLIRNLIVNEVSFYRLCLENKYCCHYPQLLI